MRWKERQRRGNRQAARGEGEGIRLEMDRAEGPREIFLSPRFRELQALSQLSFPSKNCLLCSFIMKAGSQESLSLG